MYVVRVDFGYVWIRYHDEWEVAKGLYTVRKTGGEDREGEIGRGEELRSREGWPSVSKKSVQKILDDAGRHG